MKLRWLLPRGAYELLSHLAWNSPPPPGIKMMGLLPMTLLGAMCQIEKTPFDFRIHGLPLLMCQKKDTLAFPGTGS